MLGEAECGGREDRGIERWRVFRCQEVDEWALTAKQLYVSERVPRRRPGTYPTCFEL